MKNKKELKSIKKKKRNKVQEIFSRMVVGGASVATVVVVTATAFAVGDFQVETFSDAIYFETFIEPTDFEVPEDADLSDPETEIVFEEVDLRMRLSSQFGDSYLPLDLFENQGKFTDLVPNTNYELTAQHYNGFQWVNLKSTQVRTKLENKATILNVEETDNYTESIRDLLLTIVVEAENPEFTKATLEVQGKEVYLVPLDFGEHTYQLSNMDVTDTLTFKIYYDINEADVFSTVLIYESKYDMLPYIERILSLQYAQGYIKPSLEILRDDGLKFYMIIDALDGSQIIENINNVNILYRSQLRRIRIYGKDEVTQVDYLIDSIDLMTFRPFNFVATIIDDILTLTVIDQDNRIKEVIWIAEGNTTVILPIGEEDQVYVYEVNIRNLTSYQIIFELDTDYESYYEIIIRGENS